MHEFIYMTGLTLPLNITTVPVAVDRIEIREDNINDLERLAELGLIHDEDLIDNAISYVRRFYPESLIEFFVGYIVHAKNRMELIDAKIQLIDAFTHTQSEFKTIDLIIYSKYGVTDVRHFPNLHKILTDFITVDYHQLHELRRDLVADRMYHSSINRVKHDAFNNRKYIPLTNPTWTI
jgi:hypothetical protein